jgi:tetratricopeptide (TPR) repeat protein
VQARLLTVLSSVYDGLGYHWDADSLLTVAVDLNRAHLGTRDTTTLNSMVVLASLNQGMGNPEDVPQAKALWQEILGLTEARPDLERYHARASLGLGTVLGEEGKPDSAITYVDRGIEIFSAFLEPDDPVFLDALRHKAILFRQLEMPDSAEGLYLQLLTHHLEQGPAGDQDVSVVLNNLGYVLRLQDKNHEAAEVYETGLDHYEHVRTPPETMILLNNLAQAHHNSGDRAGAERVLRQRLAYSEENWPPGHWRVGAATISVGRVVLELGDAERSLPYLRRGLEIYEAGLGPDHSWTADARNRLAAGLLDLGQYGEAEEQLERGYPILFESFGVDDPRTRSARENLVRLYEETGRSALAEDLKESGLLPGMVRAQ